jgi:hypothetical protein
MHARDQKKTLNIARYGAYKNAPNDKNLNFLFTFPYNTFEDILTISFRWQIVVAVTESGRQIPISCLRIQLSLIYE